MKSDHLRRSLMEHEQYTMANHTNPVCLITGASRGIGRALAQTFAAAGYNLILTCSKSMTELEALCHQLKEKHAVACRAYQVDMGDSVQVRVFFQKITHLDVLINNAGISHIGLLHEMTEEEWHRILSVNLDACFYTCKYSIPLMLQNHSGHIINISSVWGNVGASMEVAYSASKGGMNAFTKALAKELAPSGITVNAIACGVIDTAMNACFSEEELQNLREEIPADRFGKPDEVARLALSLTQTPTYLTGQIITLDGGWQ